MSELTATVSRRSRVGLYACWMILVGCSGEPGTGPPNPQFQGSGAKGSGAGSGKGGAAGYGGEAGYGGGSAADAGYGGSAAGSGVGGSGMGGSGNGSGVGGSGNGSGVGGSGGSGVGGGGGIGGGSGGTAGTGGGTGVGGGGTIPASEVTPTDEVKPFRLALSSSHVYWTSPTENAVRRAPKSGGVSALVAQNQGGAWDVRTDASNVYWTASTNNAVRRAPINGGSVQQVATNQAGAKGLWLTTTDVIWATGSSVMRVAKSGGTPVEVATGTGVELVVSDAVYVYYPSGNALYRKLMFGVDDAEVVTNQIGSSVRDLGLAGGFLYFSGSTGLLRVPTGGGDPTPVASSSSADKFAISGSQVYYGTSNGLFRVSTTGAGNKLLYLSLVQGVAVDAAHVYWSDIYAVAQLEGKIWRAPK